MSPPCQFYNTGYLSKELSRPSLQPRCSSIPTSRNYSSLLHGQGKQDHHDSNIYSTSCQSTLKMKPFFLFPTLLSPLLLIILFYFFFFILKMGANKTKTFRDNKGICLVPEFLCIFFLFFYYAFLSFFFLFSVSEDKKLVLTQTQIISTSKPHVENPFSG